MPYRAPTERGLLIELIVNAITPVTAVDANAVMLIKVAFVATQESVDEFKFEEFDWQLNPVVELIIDSVGAPVPIDVFSKYGS